jgi:hypothetical protein
VRRPAYGSSFPKDKLDDRSGSDGQARDELEAYASTHVSGDVSYESAGGRSRDEEDVGGGGVPPLNLSRIYQPTPSQQQQRAVGKRVDARSPAMTRSWRVYVQVCVRVCV